MSDKTNVDFELMQRLLRENNAQISGLRSEVREGFASLKAHDYALHRDFEQIERRVFDLEAQVKRLSHAQGINAPQDD